MKILFFDIDGTLVSFATHQIPATAIEALKQAHGLGHKIVISTGRPSAIITNLGPLQQAGLIDGYITMNGAYCYASADVLYKKAIPESEAAYLARVCQERKYPCIFVGEHSMSIAGKDRQSSEIFAKDLCAPPIPITDYSHPLLHSLLQLTPFFTAEEQTEIEANMPGCEFGRWHKAFVDITARGVTKAHGMDVMLRYFGASQADTIAFGDGGNDVPILEHANIGVAMGNAREEVKRAADYVAPSVDDNGIAVALKHLGVIS